MVFVRSTWNFNISSLGHFLPNGHSCFIMLLFDFGYPALPAIPIFLRCSNITPFGPNHQHHYSPSGFLLSSRTVFMPRRNREQTWGNNQVSWDKRVVIESEFMKPMFQQGKNPGCFFKRVFLCCVCSVYMNNQNMHIAARDCNHQTSASTGKISHTQWHVFS